LNQLLASKPQFLCDAEVLNIDCGANTGLSGLYLKCLMPNSTVVAVEADLANFEVLSKQAFATELHVEHAAINDIDEPLSIQSTSYGEWGQQVRPSVEKSAGVRCLTINEIVSSYSPLQPFLVKIDIEGSEERLFRSNLEWLDATPIVVVEIHDWMSSEHLTSRSLIAALQHRSRHLIARGNLLWIVSIDLLRDTMRKH
jgi:FkbM family methyltransferase